MGSTHAPRTGGGPGASVPARPPGRRGVAMMTPRERVAAALAHREPDRIPIDLGSTLCTSITTAAYLPLREHLGLPPAEIAIYEQTQQLPYLSEDILLRFGVDTRT